MTDHRADLEADLDAYEEGESWPDTTADGLPIPPQTQIAAEQVLQRVRRLTEERAEIAEVAQAKIDRATEWRDDRVAGIDRQIAFGKQALEMFWRSTATPMRRSVSLPDGRLKLTKTRFKTVVTDSAAFMAWAVEIRAGQAGEPDEGFKVIVVRRPDYVRVEIKPALDALAKLRDADEDSLGADLSLPDGSGEIVPGVECVRDEAYTFGIDPP